MARGPLGRRLKAYLGMRGDQPLTLDEVRWLTRDDPGALEELYTPSNAAEAAELAAEREAAISGGPGLEVAPA